MEDLTYAAVEWEDSPSTNTPINATNLKKMEKGIKDVVSRANELKEKVENFSHIGQIIMSTTLSTEASVIAVYGGSQWMQIPGRFILGAGTLDENHTYAAESTGGEPEHTLTVEEMPSHRHGLVGALNHGFDSYNIGSKADIGEGLRYTQNTGGGQAHNNMPPYFTAYIWVRLA